MGGVRVLVTRPQPGADRTAARLAELGYEPVVLPLTQTVPLPQTVPETLPDRVVATSPQAFHHLSQDMRAALANRRVVVTGEGTAAAARDAGFTRVETSTGNVSGLISDLDEQGLSGLRLLYLAGRVRRPDLETFLGDRTIQVDICEVYDTVSVSYSTEKLAALPGEGDFSCVLFTSVETVASLAAISSREFTQALENALFVCLSQRIADGVRSHFANRISVADEPSEDALIRCVTKAFPRC